MGGLSEEIKQFIGRYIRSIGHLEALLLLFKNRDRELSVGEIATELRTNAEYAEKQLEELAELGLVKKCSARAECFVYSSNDDLDKVLSQISSDYSRHRLAIIDQLYNQPLEKIRSFSDAFKFKKDK